MDKRNYSKEKIEQDKENVVSFVFSLLKETITTKLSALMEECKRQQESLVEQLNGDDEDDDIGDVVSQLMRQQNVDQQTHVDESLKKTELEEMLKADIKKELDNYMSYCEVNSAIMLIQNHPTDLANKEAKEEQEILKQKAAEEEQELLKLKRLQEQAKQKAMTNATAKTTLDPIAVSDATVTAAITAVSGSKNSNKATKTNKSSPDYAAPRFDVLQWWRNIGQSVYPKLALAAPIILGKPAHNGYQERVFSLGKYCDNTLRNKMKQENFEMRVLDTVNRFNDGIQNFEQLAKSTEPSTFVSNFFTRSNLKLILKLVDEKEKSNNENGVEVEEEVPLDKEIEMLNKNDQPDEPYPDDDDTGDSDIEQILDNKTSMKS
jgi:hAT family C-terminal dimerisation region